MNENQNAFVRKGRTTSRVLNRPGGTCQISLGGYTEAELERMRKNREAKLNPAPPAAVANANTGTENEKKATTNEKQSSPEPSKEKKASPVVEKVVAKQPVVPNSTLPSGMRTAQVSSNAFASSSTTNSFNVLTSRPTSRVSNQPGGKTNFTLGC